MRRALRERRVRARKLKIGSRARSRLCTPNYDLCSNATAMAARVSFAVARARC